MAKVQSSRAKIYETKASVAEEPTEHVESEGERLIKQLVLKQIDTQVTLADQLKQNKKFEKSVEYVPLTKYTSGQISLQEFEDCANRASQIEQLKSSGLSNEEVELILDHGKGEEFFSEKYKKLESSVLNSRLQQIFSKLQTVEEQSQSKQSGVSRHEQELGLSVKPNSEHTKLLQFALSCQQSASSTDLRPLSHPINKLKDLEEELFGHLRRKKKPKKSLNTASSPKFKSKEGTSTSLNITSNKPSSLWDLKDTCTIKSASCGLAQTDKPSRVYTCKPETFYTIKDKTIVPISKVPPLPPASRSPSQSSSGCCGQPFVVSDLETSDVKTLCKEDIEKNRLSVEEIKLLPRFQNYEKGTPTEVLFVKNLSNRIKEADLVSVFGHLDNQREKRIIYRLMTGKMKGQAFITFPSIEKATEALDLVNGFVLRKKPMIIQYGHTITSK
ncbi:RNA-binding protein 41-like isoform X2 [Periplaneta americana]|uniref:RRM domain-containing protein n=1 Tax=Periplaneta americana TaxID=6978 RepID=A0ABQ8SFE0_PERAM|nr:hypothetical protein ANN_21039 [Periplaneta americana]